MLNLTLYLHDGLFGLAMFPLKVNGHDWGFDVLRDVDDFFEPRDTKSDVFATDTSKMERVQGHLRGRLS